MGVDQRQWNFDEMRRQMEGWNNKDQAPPKGRIQEQLLTVPKDHKERENMTDLILMGLGLDGASKPNG